jgi:electron transport complex protein RnfD
MADDATERWVVSASPHAHSGDSVRAIMQAVALSLVPAGIAGIVGFGWDAVRLIVVCVAACVAAEYLARRAMGRECAIGDWSAVVTGLLLAYNLPPGLPSWMAVLGSVFAIVVGKQLFGGLGYNPFNPALLARVMLLVSFPVHMTTWSEWCIPSPAAGVNAITTATPLGMMKTAIGAGQAAPYVFDWQTAWQFFLGVRNGCIGEVSGLALLLGGIFLLWRRCISWHVPVFYLGSMALFAAVVNAVDPVRAMGGPLYHVLTGGVILGAFFMATDMVTTPVTKSGMALFGIGCGVITMIIRLWGGYPEGCSFSILIMNSLTPLINRATRPRVLGAAVKAKA